MSNEEIAKHMIEFIKVKERDAGYGMMVGDGKLKSEIISSIVSEIEKEIPDDNQ
jgi:hypothetical protein